MTTEAMEIILADYHPYIISPYNSRWQTYIEEYFKAEIAKILSSIESAYEHAPYIDSCIASAFVYYFSGVTFGRIKAHYTEEELADQMEINEFIQLIWSLFDT